MIIKLLTISTFILFTHSLFAQQRLTESDKVKIVETTSELTQSNNSLGFNLFAELFSLYDNIIISPMSIYAALLIANAGTKNETEQEFEKVMLFNANKLDYYKKFKFIQDQYTTYLNTERSNISINNSLWVEFQIELKHEYLNFIEYYSLLQNNQIKYSHNLVGSRKEMNEWMNENTDGKINDFIKENEISEETQLIILNNLNYYSEWDHWFEIKRTHNDYFYNSAMDSVSIPFMFKYDSYSISENDQFTLIELPYYLKRSSMCILIPKNELSDISVKNLKKNYDTLLAISEKEILELALPKFNFQSHIPLKKQFISLGLEQAFEKSSADFSGMTSDGLFIRDIIHASTIEVNEKGTSASAATAIIYDGDFFGQDIMKVKINKPFVFVIKDNLSDMILFIGKYVKQD
jgi:serpin B